ncbi:hypothetical protein E2320_017110 [Naja naja]|nr:hypothetical protein E2320_017110 [Naja naja]
MEAGSIGGHSLNRVHNWGLAHCSSVLSSHLVPPAPRRARSHLSALTVNLTAAPTLSEEEALPARPTASFFPSFPASQQLPSRIHSPGASEKRLLRLAFCVPSLGLAREGNGASSATGTKFSLPAWKRRSRSLRPLFRRSGAFAKKSLGLSILTEGFSVSLQPKKTARPNWVTGDRRTSPGAGAPRHPPADRSASPKKRSKTADQGKWRSGWTSRQGGRQPVVPSGKQSLTGPKRRRRFGISRSSLPFD